MDKSVSYAYFPSLLHRNSNCDSEDMTNVENFILNSVLPVSMAGSVTHESLNHLREEEEFNNMSVRLQVNREILTGSSAEGLCLPEVTAMKGPLKEKHFTYAADSDIKYVFTALTVDNQNKKAFAIKDSSKSHPGYTRLRFNHNWQTMHRKEQHRFTEARERHILRSPEKFIDKDGYILRRKITGILRKEMNDYIHSSDREIGLTKMPNGMIPQVTFSQHGPAITVDIIDPYSRVMASKDYVLALPCPRWPSEAEGWLSRERVWPSKKQIKNIMKRGCHIVPKAHHTSKDPCEFIISFSMIEKYVAHCLSVFQKRVYLLLKLLYKFRLNKPHRGLTTYHLKTTFFWLCEKVDQDKWKEENPLECLHWLLSLLEWEMEERNIPNYFIPECNLLDHMPSNSAECVLNNIKNARANLVQILLQSTETYRFSWLSRDISLANILQESLSRKNASHSLIKANTLQLVSELLRKGEVHVAISILCGSSNCEILPKTVEIIALLEDTLLACSEYEDSHLAGIQGLMATLYHQRAVECYLDGDSSQHTHYMEKSQQMFEHGLEGNETSIWIVGEFYNLLSSRDKHVEIVRHFIAKMHKRRSNINLYEEGVYTNMSNYNWLTSGETFYTQLEDEDFIVPSTAYILYKVFKSILSVADKCTDVRSVKLQELANKLKHDFEQWVKVKTSVYPEKIDENMYVLLGLCGIRQGNRPLAKKYFQIAASKGGPLNDIRDIVLSQETSLDKIRKLTKEDLRTQPYKPWCRKRRKNKINHIPLSELTYLRRFVTVLPFQHW